MILTPQPISTTTREGRLQILNTPNMAPTSAQTAYMIDYCFDIPEVTTSGLVQCGALAFQPDRVYGARPSPRVDFLEAARAHMLLGYGRAHHGWDAGLLERLKDRAADTPHFINLLGCFAVAVAFSRQDWEFTLSPLPGFNAADHHIWYGTAVDRMRSYAAGKGQP